jgi:hypothetical protein
MYSGGLLVIHFLAAIAGYFVSRKELSTKHRVFFNGMHHKGLASWWTKTVLFQPSLFVAFVYFGAHLMRDSTRLSKGRSRDLEQQRTTGGRGTCMNRSAASPLWMDGSRDASWALNAVTA